MGRVLTPTLTLLAEREAAIEHFKKEKFYTVELDAQGLRAASGKFNSKTDAEKLRSACLGKTAVVQSIAKKDKTERPPKLYDLTTLQRDTFSVLPLYNVVNSRVPLMPMSQSALARQRAAA